MRYAGGVGEKPDQGVITMKLTANQRALGDAYRLGPDGEPFVWGDIVVVHEVGPYQIVEFVRRGKGERVAFHPFIDGEDTRRSYGSLDRALVGVIAYRADGLNTRADSYFARMVGLPDCEES